MTYEDCEVKLIQHFTTDNGKDYAIMYIDVNGVTRRYYVYHNYRRSFDMLRLLKMGHIKEGDLIAFEAVDNDTPMGDQRFSRIWKMKRRRDGRRQDPEAPDTHTTSSQGEGSDQGD